MSTGSDPPPLPSILRTELSLWFGTAAVLLSTIFGDHWLSDLSNPCWYTLLFGWLFVVMAWLAFGVVRHADALALLRRIRERAAGPGAPARSRPVPG